MHADDKPRAQRRRTMGRGRGRGMGPERVTDDMATWRLAAGGTGMRWRCGILGEPWSGEGIWGAG